MLHNINCMFIYKLYIRIRLDHYLHYVFTFSRLASCVVRVMDRLIWNCILVLPAMLFEYFCCTFIYLLKIRLLYSNKYNTVQNIISYSQDALHQHGLVTNKFKTRITVNNFQYSSVYHSVVILRAFVCFKSYFMIIFLTYSSHQVS